MRARPLDPRVRERRPTDWMAYARSIGWSAMAAAPILLAALAVLRGRAGVSASLFTHSAIAAWLAAALAFVASLLTERGARIGRAVAIVSALVVFGWLAILLFASAHARSAH